MAHVGPGFSPDALLEHEEFVYACSFPAFERLYYVTRPDRGNSHVSVLKPGPT